MATKKISDLQLISIMADDVNIPGENTSQTYRLTGAQLKAYIQAQIADLMKSSSDFMNLGLACSVSGNALTIALKQIDGTTNPTAAAPVRVNFRNSTAATGDSTQVSATAATSVVVSSGSTLGMTDATAAMLYVYAINNGGTLELGVTRTPLDEGSVQTSVAEGGAGAADSAAVLYSTSARTGKAVRLIARLTITEATAGTWTSAPTEIALLPFARVANAGTVFDTMNGYGSSSTSCKKFSNVTNTGTAVVGVNSATLGATATILEPGLYYMDFQWASQSANQRALGITLNSSHLTSNVDVITAVTERLALQYTAATGLTAKCSALARLVAGDIIRFQTDQGTDSATTTFGNARVIKVAD